jgi:hypothetical protein
MGWSMHAPSAVREIRSVIALLYPRNQPQDIIHIESFEG